MELNAWTHALRRLHDQALTRYRAGERVPESFFTSEETAFLASIGLRPMHLYDFAEDFLAGGEPDWETTLLIVAARRDYFLREQGGRASTLEITEPQLPPRKAELGGIPWLPRIVEKARRFLAGELCREIMYCCGGDRNFLKSHRIHPADFLRVVWASRGDDAKVLAYVKASAA